MLDQAADSPDFIAVPVIAVDRIIFVLFNEPGLFLIVLFQGQATVFGRIDLAGVNDAIFGHILNRFFYRIGLWFRIGFGRVTG